MKTRVIAGLLLATAIASPTFASDLPQADAEVRRINAAGQEITLRHGDIKNLDMPPMTMVFKVKDAALLQKVKPGDKVKFTADKVNGAYTVMSLEPAP